MLTLQQLQRMLRKSLDGPVFPRGAAEAAARNISGAATGVHFAELEIRNSRVRSRCRCSTCSPGGKPLITPNLTSVVDSLTRKLGPKADAAEALTRYFNEQRGVGPPDGDQAGEDAGEGMPGESQAEPQNAGDGEPSTDELDQAQRAADQAAQALREAADNAQLEKMREKTVSDQTAKKKQAAVTAARAAKQKLAQLRQQPGKKANQRALRAAKKQAAGARRKLSMMAEEAAPSREPNRNLAKAQARVRAVSATLRRRMSEEINKLVSSTGRVGNDVSVIPSLDSKKLVKRMLVRRPLANALKEDVIKGRPVTLFLPDISPSCSSSAQAACDVANAAGYAGVSGSDVLVMPHSNGLVESGEWYTPWLNGKPIRIVESDYRQLFTAVTTGRSRYNIRAVVALGDNDAEELYAEMVQLKKVQTFIWLHNDTFDYSQPTRLPVEDVARTGRWPNKARVVVACYDQQRMMKGFAKATA